MNGFLLSSYPVSAPFRKRLERQLGPLEPVTLAELRRLGAPALLRTLRRLEGTGVLVAETESARATLPALHAVAVLTRAGALYTAAGTGEPAPTSRRAAASALAGLGAASADGVAALLRTRRASARLLGVPRAAAGLDVSHGFLHVNAAPWLGLTAGGSIAHTAGVANALAEAGVGVAVRSFGEPIGLDEGVDFARLRPPRGYALPPEANRYRFAREAVRQAQGAMHPGVVYERLTLGSTVGAELARGLGVPLVVEYNGSEVWAARHWDGRLRFGAVATAAEEATLRHARLVVTVSEPLREELTARGIEPKRIVCHPNGVDAARFDSERFDAAERAALRARYGIGPDDPLVVFVGTFGRWHGAEVLARAARAVAAEGAGIRFLFVGDGLRAPEVALLLRGLEDVAILAGLVSPAEIPLHLAAADVLASPHVRNPDGSAFFGSPTKLFEYMASGRAIVASDLDQIGDVLAGGAAELVEPGDAAALAAAIRRLASDPERRARLGSEARSRVLARYTWRRHVDAVLAALEP